MIACEIHDDISLGRGQTDSRAGGGRTRHDQRQMKTGIQLFAVPYALRVIKVYIMDVALKKTSRILCAYLSGSSTCITNGGKFTTRSLCTPYATDELGQTYK